MVATVFFFHIPKNFRFSGMFFLVCTVLGQKSPGNPMNRLSTSLGFSGGADKYRQKGGAGNPRGMAP